MDAMVLNYWMKPLNYELLQLDQRPVDRLPDVSVRVTNNPPGWSRSPRAVRKQTNATNQPVNKLETSTEKKISEQSEPKMKTSE